MSCIVVYLPTSKSIAEGQTLARSEHNVFWLCSAKCWREKLSNGNLSFEGLQLGEWGEL